MNLSRQISIFLFGILLLCANQVTAQCTNNNTPIAGGAITPTCPGTTNVPCVMGGQYALVNVTAGATYTFSTCAATFDTEITLFNDTGGPFLAENDDDCGLQSSVTWTATFTGQVRVLVDQFPCASNTTCAPLQIVCTPPPAGDCFYILDMQDSFGDGWDGSTVGVSINGGAFTNYTVTGASNMVVIGVFIGDIIVVQYTENSPFPGEISFTLQLGPGFVYISGSPPATGIVYNTTVDCVTPPAPPEDCGGGITVCNNQSFNNNTTNTGWVEELHSGNDGCLLGENQGTWYHFSSSTGGNIAFTISPNDPLDDYDFAIWGPYSAVTCPPSGQPIRCSWAAPAGDTGLNYTALDNSEGAGGDKWVNDLPVVAGMVYTLFIDNWSESGTAFDLTWNLTNGASLDCTVLPIELLSFDARNLLDHVLLEWVTASEWNNDHFVVERSEDGLEFSSIGTVAGVGESQQEIRYEFHDQQPLAGVSYYRLVQVDDNGDRSTSSIVPVEREMMQDVLNVWPNPTEDVLNMRLKDASIGDHTVHVYDRIGTLLSTRSFNCTGGECAFSLPLAEMTAGMYHYQLYAPGKILLDQQHFVKQ